VQDPFYATSALTNVQQAKVQTQQFGEMVRARKQQHHPHHPHHPHPHQHQHHRQQQPSSAATMSADFEQAQQYISREQGYRSKQPLSNAARPRRPQRSQQRGPPRKHQWLTRSRGIEGTDDGSFISRPATSGYSAWQGTVEKRPRTSPWGALQSPSVDNGDEHKDIQHLIKRYVPRAHQGTLMAIGRRF
jgi:hypothetical protein